jgi:hypothetical protein
LSSAFAPTLRQAGYANPGLYHAVEEGTLRVKEQRLPEFLYQADLPAQFEVG